MRPFNYDDSFLLGFQEGSRKGAKELSDREVLEDYPSVHLVAFHNGMLDGMSGDRFRINLHSMNEGV